MAFAVEQSLAKQNTAKSGMKKIRSENESEMEVALVAVGGQPLSASTSRVGVFDVRPNLIWDLRSGCNLSNSKHVGKAWASWTEAQPSQVVLSPMRRSLACEDEDPESGGRGL